MCYMSCCVNPEEVIKNPIVTIQALKGLNIGVTLLAMTGVNPTSSCSALIGLNVDTTLPTMMGINV